MSQLVGTAQLMRSIVRRDRVRIVVWIASIVGTMVASAASVHGIYPTAADLRRAAALVDHNATAIAFNGPAQGLETLGGRIAFETGSFVLLLVGLMSVFMLSRNTRAEEESGRLELIRATAIGRHAPMVAALLVVAAMNLVTGAAFTASLLLLGLPTAGSASFGISVALVGLSFMAITAVTAQITDNARVTSGLGGLAVGVAFGLRAVGDIGDGTLSWLSPIGWGQKMRPFAGEAWLPVVVPVLFVAACLWLAGTLASHRDLGGGLVQPRAGRPSAAPSLGRPLGLAMRLQRVTIVSWSAGVLTLGLVYGSLANDIEKFVQDLDQSVRDLIARSGVDVVDSFFGTTLLVLALLGSGFAVQATLRLHSEEAALRAEPILATPVSRWRWAASHLAIAVGGGAVVLAAGGLGVGVAYAVSVSDLSKVPSLVGDALVYLPAMGVLIGLALALFGWFPRAAVAVWGLLALCFLVGFLGEVLHLPSWVFDLSPFEHTPLVPAESLRLAPLAALTATALLLGAVGLWGLRRRDVG
jgi:ABC-2 type transport system permease protein